MMMGHGGWRGYQAIPERGVGKYLRGVAGGFRNQSPLVKLRPDNIGLLPMNRKVSHTLALTPALSPRRGRKCASVTRFMGFMRERCVRGILTPALSSLGGGEGENPAALIVRGLT
jgi:hypothetical protein